MKELTEKLRAIPDVSGGDVNNVGDGSGDDAPEDNQFIVSRDFLEPDEGQVALHESDVVEVTQRTLSGECRR